MKVWLVYPYPLFDRSKAHEDDIRAVPIGLYSIAAVLKERGHDVEILNWFDIHKRPNKIAETLTRESPDVLGFSVLNANRWGALDIAHIAKQINPKVVTVFGGVSATFLWEHFLKHFPQVDYIVTGEGEYAFSRLVESLQQGDLNKIETIPGVAYRQGGEIKKNESPPLIRNLDELPIPARYFTYQHVVSSRGCPAKCAFCGSPAFWRNKIRFRSPENMVEELELLYDRGVRFFYISDDTFTANRERVVEICRLILEKSLQVTWYAISRADYIDEDILCWMRKAGCIQISFGVESGSSKIRKSLDKNLNTAQVKKAFSLARSYGILARAYFIYGSPGETWETIEKTVDLIKEIKPLVCISYILEIYPGTKLYADYQKRCGQTDDIWLKKIEGICYFDTDPALSQKQVLAFGKRIREATYANLDAFVEDLHLVAREDLFKMHADFCSRLAMTFSHGDYAKIDAIKEKTRSAHILFEKALQYAPDHRAYFGLGLLKQRQRAFDEAATVFKEGLSHFPESEDLHVSLGVTYMNLDRFKDALTHFLLFRTSPQAIPYIEACNRELKLIDKSPPI